MTAVILAILVIGIVTVVVFFRRGWLPRLPERSTLDTHSVLKEGADPELLKPQLDRATTEWADLRKRAETDPAAAARVYEIIRAAVTSTQRALRELRGDPVARARLNQELATLWDDLAWANSRLRATAAPKPSPPK